MIRCLYCGKDWELHDVIKAVKAVSEGHIYSDKGATEFSISRNCEYCFDKLFSDDRDD